MDYRPGFRVRTAKRIARIDVKYDDTLIRRYALGYGTHPHWSLLTTLTQYGHDGVSTLPATTFGYATFEMGPPEIPLSANGRVIGSTGEPGSVADNAKVDFIDINADGLPDLLVTDAGHLAYLNRGVAEAAPGQSAIRWEGPVVVTADDARAFNVELSQSNVHLADMAGDGIADLVVTGIDWIEYFPNSGQAGWAAGQLMSVEQSPPPAPFGPDGDTVLTSDLDFDKRIDVIKSDFGSYSAWFNLGGGAFSDEVLTDGAWHGQQFIDFASPGVQLADMNGDRLNDVVKSTPISAVYCANMGFGRFDQSVEIMLPDRWLDVNGNGTTDLVYADSSLPDSRINAVDLGELIAGSSHFNALTGIDNGFGRHTAIYYRSTTGYDWDAPISSATTVAHTREGDSADIVTTQFFDGLKRALGTFEAGGRAMKDVTQYSARGRAWKVFQPYFGEPLDQKGNWILPPAALPATLTSYDATGRAVKTASPPDEQGVSSLATTDYLPLRVVQYDGEDNSVGGPHAGTPKTLVFDGLDRLIEVHEIETRSQADAGTFVTKYQYALPDLLTEIEDSNRNITYMRHDGLGRRIFMNDCDRGHTTYTYDPVGNLLSTVDAKGQHTVYTYDGANRRLTLDYLDGGTPLSAERTPDVQYHYDRPSPEHPTMRNLRGECAWVQDLTGAEFHGFNARGDRETVIKRVAQIDGGTTDFTTVSLSDSLGRAYQTVYPDGGVVRYRFDARGLLEAVPGFVEEITYDASGQRATCTFINGVTTTYSYDPRQRLSTLLAQSTSEILQHLSYHYDQTGHVLQIVDHRALAPGDPSDQTAAFTLDNAYRLTEAVGVGYGTITYDYDRLGNMVEKVSPDITDPDVSVGDMVSGAPAGTADRVGRSPGDPPGPHAITSADDGLRRRAYVYDDNGNMTVNDGDEYLYDFADHLGKIIKDDQNIRYVYDHTGRRLITRVDGVQTTYIDKLSEIRDGALVKYVFAGDWRVARVEGPMPPPPCVSQRLSFILGWNLFSFQVEPLSTDPATILADIAGKYDVLYGHDGHQYTRHQHGSPDNTLTALLPNHGYWIHMTEPVELIVEGPLSETPVHLPGSGSALIGFPGMTPVARDDLASRNPTVQTTWAYPGNDCGWALADNTSPDYVNTLRGTAPGLGYWFTSDAPAALILPEPTPADVVYYHADHLGSTNVTTDEAGAIVTETLYYPFGTPRHQHPPDPGASDPVYRFTGKERDTESGLQYFEARYYHSTLGRFTSVDPLLISKPDLQYPQSRNLYSYAGNQPLVHIDSTGNDFESFLLGSTPKESDLPDLALKTGALLAPAHYGWGFSASAMALHINRAISAIDKKDVDLREASVAVSKVIDDVTALISPYQGIDKLKATAEVAVQVPAYALDRLDDARFHGSRMQPAAQPRPQLGMRVGQTPESVRQEQRMEQTLREIERNKAPAQIHGPLPPPEVCPACYDPNRFHGSEVESGEVPGPQPDDPND